MSSKKQMLIYLNIVHFLVISNLGAVVDTYRHVPL